MRILFHCPSMHKLAEALCNGGARLGEIDWKKFPDGWPDVFIHDVERIRGADVMFLASFHRPEDIFEQWGVMCALARYGARSLTVILPFFPVGTMERVDVPGQLATAKTLARMFSSIPATHGAGVPRLITFDIHATSEQFYFDDRLQVELMSAVPIFLRRLKEFEKERGETCMIGFPDEGAAKRFGAMFPGRDLVVCRKVRDGIKRIVSIVRGDPKGRHVVFVDDQIQSGETLLEGRNVVVEHGAANVSVFSTHPVMPRYAFLKFTPDKFVKVWVTDSVPETVMYLNREPLECLSLAPTLRNLLFRP